MKIIVERGVTKDLKDLPPKSIALDGYVQGPEIDLENQRFSFDHHDKCIRLVTRATCQQVMDAILLGLDPQEFTVYVNDVDADTVLAVWLLSGDPGSDMRDLRIRELVEVIGQVDAHGPAYPTHAPGLVVAFFERVMAPERKARRDGSYQTCDLEKLLHKCLRGLTVYLYQNCQEVKLSEDPEYYITYEGASGWVMAMGEGFLFTGLYKDGYTKAICYRKLPDGSYQYTVGKKSELVAGFSVGPVSDEASILAALNKAEPGWGGGSTIGGSPRNEDGSASKLTPVQVYEIVETLLGGEK